MTSHGKEEEEAVLPGFRRSREDLESDSLLFCVPLLSVPLFCVPLIVSSLFLLINTAILGPIPIRADPIRPIIGPNQTHLLKPVSGSSIEGDGDGIVIVVS